MTKSKGWLILLASMACIICVLLGLVFLKKSQEASETNTALALEGRGLPIFQVTGQDGKKVSSKSFHDQPMLVVEWASWCPYCQRQLPVIQKLYQRYGDKIHFVMLDLADPKKERKEDADQYIKENGFTFPYYYDNGQTAADALQVETIPSLYLVDKKQRIRKVIVDVQDEKALELELKKLLD